ncbi:hypothetical protein IPG36_03940 [bacterium]|nr:MAG: hypothetical protein IPG36_03940 [bacterium]
MKAFIDKLLGDRNAREVKRALAAIGKVSDFDEQFRKLSDDALRAKTDEFRERLKTGIKLEQILPEAFAAVREAASRSIGQRHYDVQLVGALVLHQGKSPKCAPVKVKRWWRQHHRI